MPRTSTRTTPIAWHSLPVRDVLERLETSPRGLAEEEVARRRARYGPNELPREPSPTRLTVFLRQFKSPLIYILLFAAGLALSIGELADAGFVALVLLVNAMIGGWQEWKAEQSSRALQQLLQVKASVLRDEEARDVAAEEIVPGDVVWIESGGRVPADIRLLTTHGLEVDESLLTGESLAVTKDPAWSGDAGTPVADRRNMAMAGSIVVRGRGTGVVVATGKDSTVGQLAIDVIRAAGTRTPLMERMESFSRMVAVVVLVAAVSVGLLGILVHHYPLADMLMFGVALAVSAIPEGLPITITVALAIATTRMARRGVIVRRLAAVEGLGSCTLVASDKTGTLTCNELTVREVRLSDGRRLEVTGQGFVPEGQVLLEGAALAIEPLPDGLPRDQHEAAAAGQPAPHLPADLRQLVRVAVLCNEADLHRHDHGWMWRGDPTDVALLCLARKLGAAREPSVAAFPQVNEIPFEAEHRFAASYHRMDSHRVEVFVKGAPERVIAMCDGTTQSHEELLEIAHQMARDGFRVLALASGPAPDDLAEQQSPPEPAGLRLAGFVGMIDPLRPQAREAVAQCHRAGIAVTMITGDHPVTALAIARDLGFASRPDQVVTGKELESLTPEGLREAMQRVCVFARVAPHQKLQIVEAARDMGHFVAVTGDGVNDAPALRAAHIGVAMGKMGTDVAREAAELVISDDNFATIVAGIEEGRVAYDNIRKVIFLLISTGAAEVLLLGLAIALGTPLPLLPVQILWLNLVTNGIQDKALAFEPPEGHVLHRRPRPPSEPIINRLMLERVTVVALVMAVVGMCVFWWVLGDDWSDRARHAEARNVLLLVLVLMETFILGATRSETTYALLIAPWKSPWLLAAAVAAVSVHLTAMHTPGLNTLLGAQPVSVATIAVAAGLAMIVFVAIEFHKWTWIVRHPESISR